MKNKTTRTYIQTSNVLAFSFFLSGFFFFNAESSIYAFYNASKDNFYCHKIYENIFFFFVPLYVSYF